MNKLTEEQMAKGRQRFLAANPKIKSKIDALTQAEADALGMLLSDFRISETMRELQTLAHAENRDSVELFWSCVSDTADELNQMIEARNKAIQTNLGL